MVAALALMIISCSNDDNEITPQPVKTIPFTATVRHDNGATTRGIVETDTALISTWSEGEQVALVHNGVVDVMDVTPLSDKEATISGMLSGSPKDGDDIIIIYPASAAKDDASGNLKDDLLANQNGLLTGEGSIAEKYNVHKSSGAKLKVGDDAASLEGTVELANQFAIFKLTLKLLDGTPVSTDEMVIKDGSNRVLTTVKTPSDTNVMYVVVDPANTALKFSINNGNNFNKVSGLSLDKMFYLSDVLFASVGDVILSDGTFAPAGTPGAVGMICKLGISKAGFCNYENGLAIELNSNPGTANWLNACKNALKKYRIPGIGCRVPTIHEWADMIDGCDSPGRPTFGEDYFWVTERSWNCRNFRKMFKAASGSDLPEGNYWTNSSARAQLRWYLHLGRLSSSFIDDSPEKECFALVCFYF